MAFAGNGVHPFGNGDAMTLGKRVLFAEPQIGNLDSPLDRLVPQALAKEPDRRPKAQDLLLELAGGEDETANANDMVSHALHQSWRPNLPPMPPGAGPMGPNGPQAPHGPPGPPAPQGPPPPHPAGGGMHPPGPPHGGPAPRPAGPGAGQPPQQAPIPAGQQAYQGQQMQHPGPGSAQQPPVHHSGQFPVVSPHQTGPIPQVGPQQPDGPGTGASRPQAQPYVPPAAPPPHHPMQPARKRTRWVILTAIVAAVLVALFALLTVLFFGDEDEPDNSQNAAQEEDQDADGTDRDSGPSGSALDGATDGRMVFQVNEYTCGAEIPGRSSPSESGMYCTFDLRVENTSGSTITLDHGWQRLQTASGDFHRPAKPSIEEQDESLWEEIPTGDEARGSLVFLVPDDAEPEELMLHSQDGGDSARVDLSDIPRRN